MEGRPQERTAPFEIIQTAACNTALALDGPPSPNADQHMPEEKKQNGSCSTTISTSALEDGASSERVRSRLNNFEGGWLRAILYLATTSMLCEGVSSGDNTAAANCRRPPEACCLASRTFRADSMQDTAYSSPPPAGPWALPSKVGGVTCAGCFLKNPRSTRSLELSPLRFGGLRAPGSCTRTQQAPAPWSSPH